jgi:hypothetical protein
MEKKDIMKWSMRLMRKSSQSWMQNLLDDELVILAFQTMEDFLSDHITVQDGRTVALKLHERARIETEKPIIFYFRALGQMTAIIHTKTHAMGHLYYILKMCLALELDVTDAFLLEARQILNDIEGVTS